MAAALSPYGNGVSVGRGTHCAAAVPTSNPDLDPVKNSHPPSTAAGVNIQRGGGSTVPAHKHFPSQGEHLPYPHNFQQMGWNQKHSSCFLLVVRGGFCKLILLQMCQQRTVPQTP